MGSGLSDLFRRLIGPKGTGRKESAQAVEYTGYTIRPASRREGSQWLTAGVISKRFDEEVKEHHFIRADRYGNRDDAEAFTVTKAKQIIDERGDKLFEKS